MLVNREYVSLALGWPLAARTQQSIAAQIGSPSLCLGSATTVAVLEAAQGVNRPQDDNVRAGRDEEFIDALFGNACTLCWTLQMVKGEDGLSDQDDQFAAPVSPADTTAK